MSDFKERSSSSGGSSSSRSSRRSSRSAEAMDKILQAVQKNNANLMQAMPKLMSCEKTLSKWSQRWKQESIQWIQRWKQEI